MQRLSYRYAAVCDWVGLGRACTADIAIIGDPLRETEGEFIVRANLEIESQGWWLSNLCTTDLCPTHNTARNRRRKNFSPPESGSLADLVRQARIS